jgi:hypothetical protein
VFEMPFFERQHPLTSVFGYQIRINRPGKPVSGYLAAALPTVVGTSTFIP